MMERNVQPASTRPRQAMRIALSRGLIFGVIVEIVALIVDTINGLGHFTTRIDMNLTTSGMTFTQANSIVGAVYVAINLLIVAIFSFIAGQMAVKKTGRTSTGTFAGLYTGLIFGVVHMLVTIFNLVVFTLPLYTNAHTSNLSTIEGLVILNVLIQNGILLVLAAFVGTVIGMLGGYTKIPKPPTNAPPAQIS